MKIIVIKEQPEYKEKAIAYFQKRWSTEDSKMVYQNCITHSITTSSQIPLWYLLLNTEDEIIGCAGLIANDFISRQDLYPWLCALYIEKEDRGKGYSKLLIEKVKKDAKNAGFPSLYLCTDLKGYYEKYGFSYIGEGYHPWGESSGIYEIKFSS